MKASIRDKNYMEMCYALAEKARGCTSPNPYVGAVIVRRHEVVGWGYHEKCGHQHAEAAALDRAGHRAQGATAYVTLEPCIHWGRTPPCIDRILQSKLKRVVVSDYDPNPLVYRKGVGRMRAAGIAVSTGLLKEKNRRLNEAYIKFITKKIPFVILKAAVSLDGKIATRTYASQWISSSSTREYIHLMRGEYDAIMVGINTILKDNPQLTIRHPQWRNKRQIRVILDSRLRLPLHARILSTLARGDVLVFTSRAAASKKARALEQKGVRVISAPESGGRLQMQAVLEWLGKQDISSLLVEGGGRIHTEFLEQRLADKILVTYSPQLIGGKSAPSFFQGDGIRSLEEAMRLQKTRAFKIGNDILVEGYF
jgi:diaminohydroxyphosphoribosylaminopyrimidine deaminase/5-amino-6-(5-phosphoribosylamino)uracil reductase